MNAREEILERVRKGSGDHRSVFVPRGYRSVGGKADVNLFMERVSDYHSQIHSVAPEDVSSLVGKCVNQHCVKRILVPAGFSMEWLVDVNACVTMDSTHLSSQDLESMDGAITTCTVAIAETGTIVLTHGPGEGRRALSLIPDYHLVVLNEDQILAGVPDAISALDATQPMTWISGSSATSDIEMSRVEGVHGPRTLEVIIVQSTSRSGSLRDVSRDSQIQEREP
jgi:L-lactate dehydrogenase complex protein LldG